MNKKGLFLLLGGLALGALFGGIILVTGVKPTQGPVIGTQAEDFTLKDLTGQAISLDQFHGKVVVLNFWATWCVPCKDEMPLLEEYYTQMKTKVVVIGVNSQESASDVQAFVSAHQITFPIALDLSGEVTRKYLINGYPTTYFIDVNGILRDEHIGALREDLLKQYLQEAGATS